MRDPINVHLSRPPGQHPRPLCAEPPCADSCLEARKLAHPSESAKDDEFKSRIDGLRSVVRSACGKSTDIPPC